MLGLKTAFDAPSITAALVLALAKAAGKFCPLELAASTVCPGLTLATALTLCCRVEA